MQSLCSGDKGNNNRDNPRPGSPPAREKAQSKPAPPKPQKGTLIHTCRKCGRHFEVHLWGADAPACPNCKQKACA